MEFGKFHDKYYKLFLILPALMLILSFAYLGVFYAQHNDFIHKDISLTGGTSITLFGSFDMAKLKADLSPQLEELNLRSIYDVLSQQQKAVILETVSDSTTAKDVLEKYLGYTLDEKNSSFEFTGASLSSSFYNQLLIAILFAFFLMATVVFILYRDFTPSMAVIISAFADILMTLAVVDLVGMNVSTAGIIALLMLIGYSVDTDILLTSKVLRKSDEPLNHRIFTAFKTGTTMTLTALLAVGAALLVVYAFSATLTQIFTILIIGLLLDLLNTWVTNVGILKWHVEGKQQ